VRCGTASSGEFGVGKTLTSRSAHGKVKASKIVPPSAVVEAKDLFRKVSVKMKRFNGNISTGQIALHQRPEVFEAIGVNFAANIFNGMIDRLMNVLLLERGIGHRLVRINLRAGLNRAENFLLQGIALDVRNYLRANLARLAVKHSNYRRFVSESVLVFLHALRTRFAAKLLTARFMPVLGIATYKRFIDFYGSIRATQRAAICAGFHRLAYPMQHEPSTLLGNTDASRNFVTGNAILGVGDHPYDHHPLIKSDGRILEDRTYLEGELFLAARAEPYAAGADKRMLLRSTARAGYKSIRPTKIDGVLESTFRVREVNNCFLKRLRRSHGLNASPESLVCQVYYYQSKSRLKIFVSKTLTH
jgi:hypothetical protein